MQHQNVSVGEIVVYVYLLLLFVWGVALCNYFSQLHKQDMKLCNLTSVLIILWGQELDLCDYRCQV